MMDNTIDNNNNHIQIIFRESGYDFKNVKISSLVSDERSFFEQFSSDKGSFLFELAFHEFSQPSTSLAFLKKISKTCANAIIGNPGIYFFEDPKGAELPKEVIRSIAGNTPYAIGSRYVNESWVKDIIELFNQTFMVLCTSSGKSPREFLAHKSAGVTMPSRVYFHLVENKQRDNYPFAFLATYTTLNEGAVVHTPLRTALNAAKYDSESYKVLVKCIYEVSDNSLFIRNLLETGKIFHPIKFTSDEAYTFLKEIELYEKQGIVCRIPQWYTENNSSCIKLDYFDEKKLVQPGLFNKSIINFLTPEMIYHGVKISLKEAKGFLLEKEGLEQIKGKWVEVNHEQLEELIQEYELLAADGSTLIDVIKNKCNLGRNKRSISIEFSREDFLQEVIKKRTRSISQKSLTDRFATILRQYQIDAFKWLYVLKELGMGACLADDMGLGKTVEVLSFLDRIRKDGASKVLIIVPATLVDNWRHEIDKFANDMDPFILRGNNEPDGDNTNAFITICTYQTAVKSNYITRLKWDVVILDEAQAIKNHYTEQSKKVKTLSANMRIAMTGTPIENNILELWSLFDFINPGLLGSRREFLDLYSNWILKDDGFSDLKNIINPFVLRRLKTDKKIIKDLPEKEEIDITVNLTKEQIILYNDVVKKMNAAIAKVGHGKEEKIIVLTTLMKLKQICNHPSQYYGDSYYDPELSGKFIELKRICEAINDNNEKVLVFTQFSEIIPALNTMLENVFLCKGYTIDGKTSMKQRDEYVQAFQSGGIPYMILSLKTAGVGLNLTEAQNVIHFDRWWNPAVENQATDRAFRIGQKNNVTVYKFVSANTIEEKINEALKEKQSLSDSIIGDLDGDILKKMSTEEIIKAAQYRN